MNKPLVIGFATNQDPNRVAIFASSLRKIYDDSVCDVVLAVNQPQIFEICQKFKIIAVPSFSIYSKNINIIEKIIARLTTGVLNLLQDLYIESTFLNCMTDVNLEACLHPHLARWFFYKRIIALMPKPNKILVTDVADVFFQAPFFDDIREDRLCFFAESDKYGISRWNDDKYRQMYGQRELDRARGRSVVCMGVWGGGAHSTKKFIDWMVSSVYANPRGGSDQVRGNRFYHLEGSSESFEVLGNGSGAVLHVHKAELMCDEVAALAYLKDKKIMTKQEDRIIPIIHMYNRHSSTLEAAMKFCYA
jgi:hypothetical protein